MVRSSDEAVIRTAGFAVVRPVAMGLTAAETNRRSHDTEALYREHGTAVARLCRSLLRDRAEAEDATQQVFLSAHRALLNGAAPREPLAWLLAVARNECYARFRQRASAPLPAAETPDGAAADASVHVLQAGDLANVWDEIGRMPPTQREAFLLREIRGLSYGQLADELSLSPPSVRSLLLRARTRLRRRLGDVAAVLGGAPWVQALARLLAGGEGASPLPAATRAAAVGFGALALVGGGGLIARHATRTPADAGARHAAHADVRRVAAPAGVTPLASPEGRHGFDGRSSEVGRSVGRDDRSGAGSDRSGSSGESGTLDTSSGDRSSGSGSDGSNDSTAVTQPTTDGHDGGGTSSSSGSDGSSDGITSGSGSGSGGDSSSTTTTTTTTASSSGSDGSDGGGTDGGLSGGHGG